MDDLLGKLGSQAINMVIRSGIAITSSFAVQQCSRLLKTVEDKSLRKELKSLQQELGLKVKVIAPAIDLVEFKSARGNVFLESAVPLVKSLNRAITSLGKRLQGAAVAEESSRLAGNKAYTAEAHNAELVLIIRDIKALLGRIDRDVPLISIAITGSGESLSTLLTPGISPSRMLQASHFLNIGDNQYRSDPSRPVQIGPAFTLTLYMLFLGHSPKAQKSDTGKKPPTTPDGTKGPSTTEAPYGLGEGDRKPLWQEVVHKARVRLVRIPPNWVFGREHGYRPAQCCATDGEPVFQNMVAMVQPDEFHYHLEIVEDLDDGRLHDGQGTKIMGSFDQVSLAGIRESLPVYSISKIFYTDTGRILNISNSDDGENSPVLLLKRDPNAQDPAKLRAGWANDCHETHPETSPDDYDSDYASTWHDQDQIDLQLRHESQVPDADRGASPEPTCWSLPSHLDPEWLALEVFAGDDNEDDESSASDDEAEEESPMHNMTEPRLTVPKTRGPFGPSSHDSGLLAQLRHMSLRSTLSPMQAGNRSSSSDTKLERPATLAQRSPTSLGSTGSFAIPPVLGPVFTSLSLMEMLVRLACLQEFQQTTHMAVPDYIINFFLEDTSTTGLKGEARWKARNEAKKRVGFDPYLDTPENSRTIYA